MGAAADITGGLGEVSLHDITPNSQLTTVTTRAFEDENGTAANWSVRSYAICTSEAEFGMHRAFATSAFDSSNGSFTARCSDGFFAHGLGGAITGGGGQVALTALVPQPLPEPTSVNVTGLEDENGTTANWSLTSYAICAE